MPFYRRCITVCTAEKWMAGAGRSIPFVVPFHTVLKILELFVVETQQSPLLWKHD
jgi:hypothetical protein